MPAEPRRRAGGFTLLEVLVALIVVSLGMLGVIEAVSMVANNTGHLRDKTIAHWVAMNRLAEVRLAGAPPALDKTSGEVEMAGRTWRWTMEVTQTAVETMRRIDISVREDGADERSSLAALTGFYGEAVAPPQTASNLSWTGGSGRGGRRGPRRDDAGDGGAPAAEGDLQHFGERIDVPVRRPPRGLER